MHRRYAGVIHGRQKRTGHFWQGRFGAVAMDEAHLAAAVRYVVCNPVRARLVDGPREWPWSSIHAFHSGGDDGVATLAPLNRLLPGLAGLLDEAVDDDEAHDRLRRAERIGRPVGSVDFLKQVEDRLGRQVMARKRGPKPKQKAADPD